MTKETERKNVGGLYLKETSTGMKYFSGGVFLDQLSLGAKDKDGRVRIAIFRNDRKEKETQPDYNIVAELEKVAAPAVKAQDDIPF